MRVSTSTACVISTTRSKSSYAKNLTRNVASWSSASRINWSTLQRWRTSIEILSTSWTWATVAWNAATSRLPRSSSTSRSYPKNPELQKQRTRYDIYKRIGASYYGYRDKEDGVLEQLEGPKATVRSRRREIRRRMEGKEGENNFLNNKEWCDTNVAWLYDTSSHVITYQNEINDKYYVET